jgi:hypothetical protein
MGSVLFRVYNFGQVLKTLLTLSPFHRFYKQ